MNKTAFAIDTVFINYSRMAKEMSFDRGADYKDDTIAQVKLFGLEESLLPGEEMLLTFEIKNKPNTILDNNSPVRENGTFFNSRVFPRIGYEDGGELTDDKTRRKYGLEPKERFAAPTDSVALQNTYISGCLLYTSPSPRDQRGSRMPSSA